MDVTAPNLITVVDSAAAPDAAVAHAGSRPGFEPPLPLYSQAEFAAIVDRALADCRRRRSRLTVLMVHVDSVGLVDHSGSIVRESSPKLEDAALEKLARRLHSRVRSTDQVVRIDSRNVGTVLLGIDAEEARPVADRLRRALEGTYSFDELHLTMTLHIGRSSYPALGVTGNDLVRAAARGLAG